MRAVLAICLIAAPLYADTSFSLTGSLDPNNPNDLFVFPITTVAGVDLLVQSYGFGGSANAPGGKNIAGQVIASGGFDTYLSVFQGTGPSATFLTSSDDGFCPPGATDGLACRDSALDVLLAPGDYTLILSVFDNFSYAENLGAGTLGDGYIGLGNYYNLDTDSIRTANWALDISGLRGDLSPIVPEPVTWTLAAAGLFTILIRNKWRK